MSFTYNNDGLRTTKTLNGVVTTYYYQGSLLIAEETNSQIIVYLYDSNGAPIGFKYRGSSYASGVWDIYGYEKNLQGDIIGVYDTSTGNKLIEYKYNAWGICSTSYYNSGMNTTATKNPFKYRGYYYDVNLGLYYLQTRYYDPVIGRFISPDYPDVITASPTALTDKNLFAYCDNNPVMRADEDGMFWGTLFDVVSLGFSIYDVCNNPDDVLAWLGLAGDLIDLLPVISGLGEATDLLRISKGADNLIDAGKIADGSNDIGKCIVKYGDEIKAPNQIKVESALDAWNDFLGPNQTSFNRFTGKNEVDRIFSADGTKSIRFGKHEMTSMGTPKAHFHYETWNYDYEKNIVHVQNILQRLK